MSTIASRLDKIRSKLQPQTHLMAVSKTMPIEAIMEACAAGQRDFGENKVQDLFKKSIELKSFAINWHFIGHLQSNKINQLLSVPHLKSIHSIDSNNLLKKLLQKKVDAKIGLFLQVNTSGESEKSGFESNNELLTGMELISESSSFYLQGLMTIGKLRSDNFLADAEVCFEKLFILKEELEKESGTKLELSMGMSQDFEIAQRFQSNWVRIGSDIFGPRK
jgi:PLP dependent protein